MSSEWPLLAAGALLLFRPELKKFIAHITNLKIGGTEVTVKPDTADTVLDEGGAALSKMASALDRDAKELPGTADDEEGEDGYITAQDDYEHVIKPQTVQGLPSDFRKNLVLAQVGMLMASTRHRLDEIAIRVGDGQPGHADVQLLGTYVNNFLFGLSRIIFGYEDTPESFLMRMQVSFESVGSYTAVRDSKTRYGNALVGVMAPDEWRLLMRSANVMTAEVAKAAIDYAANT